MSSTDATGYRPIDCSVHDRLEAFAVSRTDCRVTYTDPATEERTITGRIVDVFTRDGAEFLRMDEGSEIRLDRLRSCERV
ncbi:MAG: hypothetical protein U5R14_01190 [Gemmatimonadota bacterium]|nr:hypothetical protein [Gemmatimonadota bacterium]